MARPKIQLNRKTDILDMAQALFSEKSFEKTSIDEIAKSIGISKGSVYLDFKNKEDILVAIIERDCNILAEQSKLVVENANPPYLEVLRHQYQQKVSTVFDKATSRVHTHIALFHTSYRIRQKLNYIMQRFLSHDSILLEKAAINKEILPFDDYYNLASLIYVSHLAFFPPYDLKYSVEHNFGRTKEEIKAVLLKDVSIMLEIILTGLKTANLENKKDKKNE
jgi:AcrR family transcriptional regulator